jgi:hypothetical protein
MFNQFKQNSAMYTLFIPADKIKGTFVFEYIDPNNEAKSVKSGPGRAVDIPALILLTAVVDKKNKDKDVSKRFAHYILDISLYFEYKQLVDKISRLVSDGVPLSRAITQCRDLDLDKHRLCQNILEPAISYFLHKNPVDSVFIRHGLEIFSQHQYTDKETVFPLQSASCWRDGQLYVNKRDHNKSIWSKEKKDLQKHRVAFPIEVDSPPFCADTERYKLRVWPKDPQEGFCSNHDALYSWNRLKGYVRFSGFKELGGKVIHSKRRDHLYACADIPLKEWVFIFQNIEESRIEKSKYWGWTQKQFTTAQMRHSIHLLLNVGCRVVPQELIYLLISQASNKL